MFSGLPILRPKAPVRSEGSVNGFGKTPGGGTNSGSIPGSATLEFDGEKVLFVEAELGGLSPLEGRPLDGKPFTVASCGDTLF